MKLTGWQKKYICKGTIKRETSSAINPLSQKIWPILLHYLCSAGMDQDGAKLA
jgi:hypothetical protein